ncbi:conserved Plasmodium protein, unknown function [Plasmodium berghei]|uniref:UBX domain-containing protein, putative n=2 Tax=Plasmodium berghei TaxID=5821 RepID=A0A509AJ74_PLABA|nr:UBX domain-containing protein, putative [Plasmodium berghei ANKA]CXI37200.1 conserved Plasmodium protein, unknown function [Plasmodium berghei]SCM21654.1 conserved Plasmodium protein, unknown function [Plasmodium berghei]SCN24854.1 conserved Plasmodium protein, unknown function [Plasmodium berghei]SCO59970.1 conserved Plasmodium protein, unknown function [Plasmodium berghei]SCO61354.1 conserved Plasmodium protein, unknown function [Plasmodium berghei]|eukprot:XP_034421329.1 UBX domain-containing protein, putative [Plasmodium berghei ANKA]
MDNEIKLFMEMTKLSDKDEAKRLVEMCNGNLEDNIVKYLKNGELESLSQGNELKKRKGNEDNSNKTENIVNDKVYKKSENNIVKSHFFEILNNIRGVICPLFRNIYNMITSCFNLISSYILNSCNKNSFTVYYEEKYGKIHVNFFNGNLKDAINKSKKEEKLLLVYLHIDNEESEYFCKHIYTNIEIIPFFENNCILYAQDISKYPFIELHDKINIYMFPQISILLTYTSNIKELSVIYGRPSATDIIQSIIECIEKAAIEKNKMERNRSMVSNVNETVYRDRLLREEQDREYQEALKKDKEILEKKKKKENEKLLKIEKKKNYIKDIKNKRNEKSKKFPLNIEPNDKVTKILLRLPNGLKVQNNFSSNHTLRDIYDWAECCDILEVDKTKKQNMNIPCKFDLICGHTKYVLKNSTNLIKEFDLYPNAVLNMKSLDSSDNEE